MSENNFTNTVESLFKGMECIYHNKDRSGETLCVLTDGTIVLPLVDVSFGVAPVHLQTDTERKTTVAAVWAVKSSQVPC